MSEPSEPHENLRHVARLLLKAVKGLPEDEQAAVFEYFFAQQIATTQRRQSVVAPQLREMLTGGPRSEAPLSTLFSAQRPSAAQQMIPVRLSEVQHRRLKQWCEDHDFPMSVVVRGLIERFLDSWEERAG